MQNAKRYSGLGPVDSRNTYRPAGVKSLNKGAGILGYFEMSPEGARGRAIRAAHTKHTQKRIKEGKPFL